MKAQLHVVLMREWTSVPALVIALAFMASGSGVVHAQEAEAEAEAEVEAEAEAEVEAEAEAEAGAEIEPLEPLPSPTPRPAPAEEPTIAELEEQMVPTLTLPEFRLRAGGGVGIQMSGASEIYGRVVEEFEWQPAALQFLLVGIGGAQSIGQSGVIYQVGGRIGGHAWFCEDRVVRCQGVIALQLGYVGGAAGSGFDFSADLDLRLLFERTFEVFARGGFLSVGLASFLNITAGVAVAF